MQFHVTVDMTEFERAAGRTMRELTHLMSTGATGACAKAVASAKSSAPFKNRTGALRSSIHAEPGTLGPRASESWFVSPQFYALFVEAGTQAHDIWPKAGHGTPRSRMRVGQSARDIDDIGTHRVALRWYVGGHPVFARMVHHPGGKPYPYMGPASIVAHQWLVEYLQHGFVGLQTVWN